MCFINTSCIELWFGLTLWAKSLCCTQPSQGDEQRSADDYARYNDSKYDFIVEKLAIKHVPVCLFATAYDIDLCRNGRDNSTTLLNDQPTTSGLLASVSKKSLTMDSKKLRFSKLDETIEDKYTYSPSMSYSHGSKNTIVNVELINTLTAFHPHLKDCERPPKEPRFVDTTIIKSQRSFAEELSEFAAKKNQKQLNNLIHNDSIENQSPSTSKD